MGISEYSHEQYMTCDITREEIFILNICNINENVHKNLLRIFHYGLHI